MSRQNYVRNHLRSQSLQHFENLEQRNLLAGITFSSGVITIEGSANADAVHVTAPSAETLNVVIYGSESQNFELSQVGKIVFHGHEGNDWFQNETGIPTEAFGNSGNDFLRGGDGDDMLSGGDGNDQLFGGAGTDMLYGHRGLDHAFGESGNDKLWLGDGDDFADGGSGSDQLFGGLGRDHLRGGDDSDFIRGEDGGDYLFGDHGSDAILGEGGADFINGGAGNDDVKGGSGDDAILGRGGSDNLNGDDGNDWISGGSESDRLFGSNGLDQILGGDGIDEIWGGNDADFLRGDEGNDMIRGGQGDDSIYGNDGDDDLFGDEGRDYLYGHDGNDNLNGNSGNDVLNGNKGNDSIIGDSGSDRLRGHSGNDTLNGGSQDDDLAGGRDSDQLTGGEGNDDFISDPSDLVNDDAYDYSADGDFEIRGAVTNLNTTNQTFNLLGLRVSYAGAFLEGSFQNGTLVKAEGTFDGVTLNAVQVEIDNRVREDNFEARGIVANLNAAARTFEIYGILINYANAEVNVDLADGTAVFVEGSLSNNAVAAREVHFGTGDNNTNVQRNFELRAEISNLDESSQTFQILGITVDYSSAFLQTRLSNGLFVKVDGDLSSSQITARQIEQEFNDDRDENVEAIGTVSNVNQGAQTFELLGLVIDFSNARLDDGVPSNGDSVEVDGWFANGSIDAERVRNE